MKNAIYNGEIVCADIAITQDNGRGYIYSCVECGGPARLHHDGDHHGHFEHQDRNPECTLSHVPS